jgi:hypothetical protein
MADRPRRRSPRFVSVLTAGLALLMTGMPAPVEGQDARPSRVLTLEEVRAIPRHRLESIGDYRWAAAAALSVIERELRFPPLHGEVQFYSRGDVLKSALVAEGHSSATADAAVGLMDGIASPGRIRINVDAMYALAWPARIWVLAHELTHVAQYQLAGGRRGSSPQWLREGMAEWVGLRVLETLGRGSGPLALKNARRQLGRTAKKRRLPSLSDLATPASWILRVAEWSHRPLYDLSLVAATDLIERHGMSAALDYFAAFARSDEAAANFRLCFGEEPAEFEARFDAGFR